MLFNVPTFYRTLQPRHFLNQAFLLMFALSFDSAFSISSSICRCLRKSRIFLIPVFFLFFCFHLFFHIRIFCFIRCFLSSIVFFDRHSDTGSDRHSELFSSRHLFHSFCLYCLMDLQIMIVIVTKVFSSHNRFSFSSVAFNNTGFASKTDSLQKTLIPNRVIAFLLPPFIEQD